MITTGNNPIPLEILLTSPILWQPISCDFLSEAHNTIKETNDPEIQRFKIELDRHELSSEWMLWDSSSKWSDILGDEDFNLVTRSHNLNRRTNAVDVRQINVSDEECSSVAELLRIIRNKLEHNKLFENVEKEKLGWFCKVHGTWQFGERYYVKYWTSKFPQLEAFLWWQFRKLRTLPDLEKFYPYWTSSGESRTVGENNNETDYGDGALMDFPCQLWNSLERHLEKGQVKDRYLVGSGAKGWTLEFRTLEAALVHRILGERSTMEIEVLSDSVTCKWQSSDGKSKKRTILNERVFKCSNLGGHNEKTCEIFVGKLIIANKISDINCHDIVGCGSNKTIIFTNREIDTQKDAETFIKNFQKFSKTKCAKVSIKWEELSDETCDRIVNKGHLLFQSKIINVKELLPEDASVRNEILCHLEGNMLTELLENGNAEILQKQSEVPAPSDIYLDRLLYNRDVLHSSIFRTASRKDIFLVVNIPLVDFQGKLNGKCGQVAVIDNMNNIFPKWKLDTTRFRIFLLENMVNNFKEIISNFQGFDENIGTNANSSRRIHFLRYLQGNKFQWLATHGPFSSLERAFTKASKKVGMVEEDKLLEKVERCRETQRLIFIADKPGMGKSQILLSLAKKLVERKHDRFIVHFRISEFLDKIWKGQTKIDVMGMLTELLCSNQFEKCLAQYWLQKQSAHGSIFLELLFDGLDEIQNDRVQLAFQVIKTILNQFLSIRVWATLRDHMLDEIRSKFGCLGWKLKPFSKADQVDFLTRHWWKSWREKVSTGEIARMPQGDRDMRKLERFSGKCLQVSFSGGEAEIAGIPLQCRMIAEIYEEKVLNGDLTFATCSNLKYYLTDLYDKLLERKNEVYLKEKKNLNVQMNDYIATTITDAMERSHIYFAIKLLFSEDVANEMKNQLFISPEHIDNVLQVGIVHKLEPLSFVHRTYAEYIVAKFVCKVITGQFVHLGKGNEIFQELLWNHVLGATFHDYDIDSFSQFNFPTLCYFLNALLEKDNNWQSNANHYRFPPRKFLRNEFEVALEFAEESPLFAAASQLVFSNIFALVISEHKPSHIFQLLSSALLCQRHDLCKYLIEHNLDILGQERLHMFQEYDNSKYGVIHWLVVGLGRYYTTEEINEEQQIREFLKYLVERHPDVLEQRDVDGRTPLLLLLKGQCPADDGDFWFFMDLVKYFVKDLGANVNVTDNLGNTVLHVTHECISISSQLRHCDHSNPHSTLSTWLHNENMNTCFAHGCNKANTVNINGLTPLLSAMHSNAGADKCTFGILEDAGADLNAKDPNGDTALHIAIQKGYALYFIKELIGCGGDIGVGNAKGQCSLHLAVEMGNVELVKWLVENDRNLLEIVDNDGKTVLNYDISDELRNLLCSLCLP